MVGGWTVQYRHCLGDVLQWSRARLCLRWWTAPSRTSGPPCVHLYEWDSLHRGVCQDHERRAPSSPQCSIRWLSVEWWESSQSALAHLPRSCWGSGLVRLLYGLRNRHACRTSSSGIGLPYPSASVPEFSGPDRTCDGLAGCHWRRCQSRLCSGTVAVPRGLLLSTEVLQHPSSHAAAG